MEWNSNDFSFSKTCNWMDEKNNIHTDYYFKIEPTKREQLLHSIMEQGMKDISHVIFCPDEDKLVLEVQYLFNTSYISYADPQMYDCLYVVAQVVKE